LGNGHWAMGVEEAQDSDARSNTILSMPHAQFPMPQNVIKYQIVTFYRNRLTGEQYAENFGWHLP
jgi:hypothetical protein